MTSLSSNRNRIFESSSRHEGNLCTLAFEQRICSHGRTVSHRTFGRGGHGLVDGSENGIGGIGRSREYLSNFQGSIIERNTIREGTTAVDCDTHENPFAPFLINDCYK